MEHFPEFENDVEFTERLISEQSVFCLPATVSLTLRAPDSESPKHLWALSTGRETIGVCILELWGQSGNLVCNVHGL